MNKVLVVLVAVVILAGPIVQVPAQEPPDLAKLQREYDRLKRRMDEMEASLVNKKLCQVQREEVIELIKQMNKDASTRSALPSWMQDFKIYGDLRLRYEGICRSYHWDNVNNRRERDRNRARFRLRVGATKTWWDKQLEVGFRLASGENNVPTSTNQTFTGAFSEKDVWIDLAYAKWRPEVLKGFTLVGGKFALKGALVHTDLIWDSDVNPEGVWAQYKAPLSDAFQPFVNAGYFIFSENARASHDGIMMQYQAGFDLHAKPVQWTCALTYYDYDHYDTQYAAARNNTLTGAKLEDFQMINFTNILAWAIPIGGNAIPMSAYFDWVHNCKDEFPAYFTDADFGFTNRKGHVFRLVYSLDAFLTVGATVFHTQPVAGANENLTDTSVRAEVIWKFWTAAAAA